MYFITAMVHCLPSAGNRAIEDKTEVEGETNVEGETFTNIINPKNRTLVKVEFRLFMQVLIIKYSNKTNKQIKIKWNLYIDLAKLGLWKKIYYL